MIGGGVASGVACVLVNSCDEVDERSTVDVRTVVDVFVLELLLLLLFVVFGVEWEDGLEVPVGCGVVLLWPVGYDGLWPGFLLVRIISSSPVPGVEVAPGQGLVGQYLVCGRVFVCVLLAETYFVLVPSGSDFMSSSFPCLPSFFLPSSLSFFFPTPLPLLSLSFVSSPLWYRGFAMPNCGEY